MPSYLEFEKPLYELQQKIEELKTLASQEEMDVSDEIEKLQRKLHKMREKIFSRLTPWQKVQLARHPDRPYALDFIKYMITDFTELHGDRLYRDDPAVVGGIGFLDDISVVVIGTQKGRTTKEKLYRNFGMAHPEGYRKALRLMKLAEKFNKPVITLIDTAGAYPGIGAEERGQAMAIAVNIMEMADLKVPIVAIITGEGGSGGALAIGVGDRVFMMEYSVYSVISPEGCASILWRDASHAPEAAKSLKLTADELLSLGVIDGIIPEPSGGAHTNHQEAALKLKEYIKPHIEELMEMPAEERKEKRIEKFMGMGIFANSGAE